MSIEALPEGWLTDAEAALLQELARNRFVLEIGSWKGRSTVALARVALHVVSVDHHQGSEEHSQGALPEFLANLKAQGVRDKVSVCVMDSVRLRIFRPASFDLVFVDGAHDFGSASRDVAAAFGLVHMGGVVAVHDYRPAVTSKTGVVTSSWPQVVAAVDDIAQRSGWRIDQVVDDLAVLRI